MSRLFISHATADRQFVEDNLLGLLTALGFDVWFAEDDIASAEQWERSIRSGIESSEWFVLIMSKRSSGSEWVKDELNLAIDQSPNRLIPILIDDCNPGDIHIRLSRIQYIDFRQDHKTAQEKLINLLVHAEYKTRSLANIVNALMRCPSIEILTVVRTETTETEQRAQIVGANARADEFYGRRSGLTIAGTDTEDIFELLSNWLDPHNFETLLNEQRDLYAKARRGQEVYATVPININDKHPVQRMRVRQFLPITIAYSNPEEVAGKRIEYFVVMYLDLNEVCKEPAHR